MNHSSSLLSHSHFAVWMFDFGLLNDDYQLRGLDCVEYQPDYE